MQGRLNRTRRPRTTKAGYLWATKKKKTKNLKKSTEIIWPQIVISNAGAKTYWQTLPTTNSNKNRLGPAKSSNNNQMAQDGRHNGGSILWTTLFIRLRRAGAGGRVYWWIPRSPVPRFEPTSWLNCYGQCTYYWAIFSASLSRTAALRSYFFWWRAESRGDISLTCVLVVKVVAHPAEAAEWTTIKVRLQQTMAKAARRAQLQVNVRLNPVPALHPPTAIRRPTATFSTLFWV